MTSLRVIFAAVLAFIAGCARPIYEPNLLPPAKIHGLCFSPYTEGKSPGESERQDIEDLRGKLSIIAPYTRRIRTFGTNRGIDEVGSIAHELGLKIAAGAWLGSDSASNELQLQRLIRAGLKGHIDIAVGGGETLYRKDLPIETLIEYIERVKDALPDVPVPTNDGFRLILKHPRLMDACDVFMVNYYPFWESLPVDKAVRTVDRWHREVLEKAGDKPVIIGETGWPSAGDRRL